MSILNKLSDIINSIDQYLETDMNPLSKSSLKFYTAWFCPFAQRVWLALEYKQIPYEYIEVDPYNKSKDWLEKNPRGLVPTICHNNQYIYESLVIMEYLDDAFSNNDIKLYPSDPYKKAFNRIWIDHINKKCIKPFYEILQFQQDRIKEREECIQNYFNQISIFIEQMDTNGPFFNGNTMNAIDLVLLPWASRIFLLEYYRNIKLDISLFKNKYCFDRYLKWYNACIQLDCFIATTNSINVTSEQYREEMIKKYKRYADNTAKTMVADAVNKGLTLP